MLFLDLADCPTPSLEQLCATYYHATETGISYLDGEKLTTLITYPSYFSLSDKKNENSELPQIKSIKKTIRVGLKYYKQSTLPQFIKYKNRIHFILQNHRDQNNKPGFFLIGPFFLYNKKQSQLHYSHYITDFSKGTIPNLKDIYYKIPIISKQRYHELGTLLILILRTDMDFESPKVDTDETAEVSASHYTYEMEKALCKAILDYDKEKIKEYTASLSNYPIACLSPDDPIRTLKNNFIASCAIFTRLAIEVGIPEATAFAMSDSFIQDIEACESFHSIKSTYYKLLMGLTETIHNAKIKGYSTIVRKGIRYILAHIKDDSETLSLSRIADHVGVHPNYFSKRFTQETGTPVSRYIRRAKVEEAKKLLEHTRESILDIACCQLKFTNQSYFSKVFKEEINLTPAQYRNQCIKTT